MIGPIEETIHQYQDYKKRFPEIFKIACIENKPKVAQREEICLGASAEEIALLIKTLGFRFCFDFAHAICYAAWAKKPWQEVIKDFMKLNPYMFHICDGHISSVKDCHFHFSDGDYDMKTIVSLIPPGSLVSLETPKDFKNSLEDFIKDVEYIRSLEKEVIHQK
jgi:endonuclease IV